MFRGIPAPVLAGSGPSQSRRILWLSILKFFLITFILLVSALTTLLSPDASAAGTLVQHTVVGLVVFEYFTVLGMLWLLRDNYRHLHWCFLGTVISDAVVTSILVHVTGGAISPYVILYMVGIISSAIAMPAFWAGSVTFLSITLYSLVAVAGKAGWIPPLSGQTVVPVELPLTVLATRLSLNISAMAAISALSITFARHLSFAELSNLNKDRQIQILFTRHQDILRSLPDGILCLSTDGTVLDTNFAFNRLFGQEIDRGMSIESLPTEITDWIAKKPDALRTRLNQGSQWLDVEVSVQDFFVDGQLSGYILVARNRSEITLLERQVAQQEKLAALGRLTASIAHEIRNPLTSIAGSLELLKPMVSAEDPDSRELFGIIFKEIRRLNELISELRVYTSRKKPNSEKLDLVEFIQETVMLCEADPKKAGTRFTLELPEKCFIRFDPGGLRQVLLNLVINAIQAAPETWVRIRLLTVAGEVHVEVEDPGPGIPEELQEKIFEPFVSTKNSGTGLGLAVASHILLAHGGRLELATTSPEGTIMRLVIPAFSPATEAAPSNQAQ